MNELDEVEIWKATAGVILLEAIQLIPDDKHELFVHAICDVIKQSPCPVEMLLAFKHLNEAIERGYYENKIIRN